MEKLCRIDDIADGASKGIAATGLSLFLVRLGEQVYAYRNSCPHTGINLEWLPDRFLSHDGEFILCSLHGALFTLSEGKCIYGPCSGQFLQPVDIHIQDRDIYLSSP